MGLWYKAQHNGCQHRFTNPHGVGIEALPHEGASGMDCQDEALFGIWSYKALPLSCTYLLHHELEIIFIVIIIIIEAFLL